MNWRPSLPLGLLVLAAFLAAAAVLVALLQLSLHPPVPALEQKKLPLTYRAFMPRLTRSPMYQEARRNAQQKAPEIFAALDRSTTRLGRAGRYRLTLLPGPVTLNEFQTWAIHVETPQGQPVSGAHLDLSGGMPQHRHGLPTRPRVTAETAPGEYRAEGLQFSMPGWWELSVYVAKDKVEDTATFNVVID